MSSPTRTDKLASMEAKTLTKKRTRQIREPSTSRSPSLSPGSPQTSVSRRPRSSTPEKRPRRRRQTSSSRSASPQNSPSPKIPHISAQKDARQNRPAKSSSRQTSPVARDAKSKRASQNLNVASPKNDENAAAIEINLLGKTGGAYIPPARLRQMQAKITDKSSEPFQRIAWEALKKSIHGLINKVNVSNIAQVVRQLLSENIVRGRGLFVRSLITSQSASPTFTHVFAALIAVVNTKFPQVGELLLKRLINEFIKAFRRNQKDRCLTTARFIAHLVNQKLAHELIVLELLTLLLEQTTDDSVEVSVATIKECGALLSRVVPKGVAGIFDHLRRILNESQCDKRISYMIEVLFQIRRDGWKDHPSVLPELDLINEDDQITHTLSLLDPVDPEDGLNIFHIDPDFEANEEKYAAIRASFLEDEAEDSVSGSESGSDDSEGEDVQGPGEQDGGVIIDQTETNLVHLRRTIYLMLQSSISADEGAHRLLQLKIKPGEEYEVASMVLDCCAQTRSYETRYGRLAQRLCHVILFSGDRPKPGEEKTKPIPSEPPRTYVAQFEKIFGEQYVAIHRLETPKLKNVAFFFAHLLYTDSISWGVFECVHLNERDTSSSGRIFLKYLFQELCSYLGLAKLQARLRDETLQSFFAHLLPRDNPKDTRFAINFLTTIGLGGLTLDLREHLQATKAATEKARVAGAAAQLDSSSSSSSSSTDSASSASSSSSDSESDSGDSSSDSSTDTEKEVSRRKTKNSHKKIHRKASNGDKNANGDKQPSDLRSRKREPSPFDGTREKVDRKGVRRPNEHSSGCPSPVARQGQRPSQNDDEHSAGRRRSPPVDTKRKGSTPVRDGRQSRRVPSPLHAKASLTPPGRQVPRKRRVASPDYVEPMTRRRSSSTGHSERQRIHSPQGRERHRSPSAEERISKRRHSPAPPVRSGRRRKATPSPPSHKGKRQSSSPRKSRGRLVSSSPSPTGRRGRRSPPQRNSQTHPLNDKHSRKDRYPGSHATNSPVDSSFTAGRRGNRTPTPPLSRGRRASPDPRHRRGISPNIPSESDSRYQESGYRRRRSPLSPHSRGQRASPESDKRQKTRVPTSYVVPDDNGRYRDSSSPPPISSNLLAKRTPSPPRSRGGRVSPADKRRRVSPSETENGAARGRGVSPDVSGYTGRRGMRASPPSRKRSPVLGKRRRNDAVSMNRNKSSSPHPPSPQQRRHRDLEPDYRRGSPPHSKKDRRRDKSPNEENYRPRRSDSRRRRRSQEKKGAERSWNRSPPPRNEASPFSSPRPRRSSPP